MKYDKAFFILGMVTAFCECVANGCKRLALSPPMKRSDFEAVEAEARAIIEKHGLLHYHEENADLAEGQRFDWLLIARRPEVIDEYVRRRQAGMKPSESLAPFSDLLSYNAAEAVSTGYDAYAEIFGA